MEQQNNEINDEINLYDYWKVLVKREKVFLSIFLIPLGIAIIISLILPRYYRGESEITIPAIAVPNTPSAMTAPYMVSLIGTIDDAKKVKIFVNNSGAIESVLISIPQKSTDKISITINAKTADILPQAFKDIFGYIDNIPEIKEEIAKIKEENDLKLKKLIEVKNANHVFLNEILDLIKKRQVTAININPADLVKSDDGLSLEIKNLQRVKVKSWILGPPSITKQPANSQIKNIIIITGLLSLMAGIFVVFFLEYINRMKARENK
jgi:hypothetical protein